MLRRYWFLLAMAPVIALGGVLPAGGPFIREHLVLPLVAAILFISGFTLDARNAVRQARNGRAVLLSLVATYALAPAAAYALARVLGPPLGGAGSPGALFLQATMIAAAQASTLATAVVLTGVAGGDRELALVLTVVSNAAAPVLTPLVLELSIGSRVEMPVLAMMGRLGAVIIAPLGLGLLARRLLWRDPGRALAALGVVPQLIILCFMYTAFSSAAGHLRAESTLAGRFLAVCLGLHAVMLAATALLGRVAGLSARERPAVVFTGSQKTVPNGIYLWSHFFPANPYGAVPLVLHQIIQLVAGNVLASWQASRLGSQRTSQRASQHASRCGSGCGASANAGPDQPAP